MPGNGQDCGVDPLEMRARPPVIILGKITDGNDTRTTGDGKLVLERTPAHVSCGPVDTQLHQTRLPFSSSPIEIPNKSIFVLGASHNAIGLRCPVDTRDQEIVLK